ncbi:protein STRICTOSIDINE SYNTHASE-LIKE 3 [Cinnamomum micranthum f. kanehirae]|uniref:Protein STRICTOSIDINE SYNTHASE-LIKE 3 n=1 Tax=Cinnamomum micranthum f. kanehirae TaxID=337451 RepID=A0A3S3MVL3_9MAGN|nr:protein STRICTOSIDINE SYNTHASE-LIKE 3 [Cinnamomum micranthum f. kanehirae]
MAAAGTLAGIFFLTVALYCGIDPFKHSAISDFPDFEAFKVDLAPWSEIPAHRDAENRLQKSEIRFLNQVQGPESVAFDPLGRGPYTGVADGRILFWNGESWSDFAYTSPNRSELCDPKPSPLSYLKNEHICGRPLGLRFDKKTGDLYIADAYFGLLKVGPEGGLATPLATEAEGVVFSAEDSGRLLKYNPVTQETTVLIQNLQFPNGVSMSKDGSFFVFCELSPSRLRRYWLKGEKAGTSEVFAILPGFPDNIRTNEKGEFWVAIHSRRTWYSYICGLYPKLRLFLLKLPISAKIQFLLTIGGRPHALIIKYSPDGEIIEVLEDSQGKVVKAVSEVEEKDGKLWMGSVLMPFMASFGLEDCIWGD